jgi:hypothetical protein
VRDLCHANSEWMQRVYQLRYTLLEIETGKILAGQTGDPAMTDPPADDAPFAPEGARKSRS